MRFIENSPSRAYNSSILNDESSPLRLRGTAVRTQNQANKRTSEIIVEVSREESFLHNQNINNNYDADIFIATNTTFHE